MITKDEARVLKELVLADGVIAEEERMHLQGALSTNSVDYRAQEILSSILVRFAS